MPEPTRKTRQREAIREAIAAAKAPVGPKEILDAATGEAVGLGLATVYRTLKLLVEAGEVLTVDIPGESPRYELTGKGHHHHFLCKTCDKVYELDGCCGHFDELTPKGFEVESHDLTLFGRCATCSKKTRTSPGVRDSSRKVHKHSQKH